MRVLVTGAGGFVGRALVRRLLADGVAAGRVDTLVALDLAQDPAPEGLPPDPRLRWVTGSLVSPQVLDQALAEPVDQVFHLASMPGGAAEASPDLGRQVNLDATVQILTRLREQGTQPRFVFASTVAVYGQPWPDVVDEHTPPCPGLSYGAHKLAAEVLIADADRRGWVQACSLRLPGVVARPGEGTGLMSAFMSQLFWRVAAGLPIVLPVDRDGASWWISVDACVDNLLHAAAIDTHRLDPRRVVQMPAQHLRIGEVVDALVRVHGESRRALVSHEPDERVQRLFASYPPLFTPQAHALGFVHDGTVDELVRRAVAP